MDDKVHGSSNVKLVDRYMQLPSRVLPGLPLYVEV